VLTLQEIKMDKLKKQKKRDAIDEEDIENEPKNSKKKSKPLKKLSPTDEYFANLNTVVQANNMIGYVPLVAIVRDGEEEEDEDDKNEFTAAELNSLRCVLVNAKRQSLIDSAMKFVDPNGGWFNTNSGNIVIEGIPKEVKKAKAKKTIPEQFDQMFALTYALKELDFWMHDNECWGKGEDLEKAITLLGKTWKKLLTKSNTELGIDAEFSRPGIESLLLQFAESVENCESIEKEFKWN